LIVSKNGDVIIADDSGKYAMKTFNNSSDINSLLYQTYMENGCGDFLAKNDLNRYIVSIDDIETTGWALIVYENERIVLRDLYVTELIMFILAIFVTFIIVIIMKRYGREVSYVEQKANRAKTEFISRISHDIRTTNWSGLKFNFNLRERIWIIKKS